MNSKHKTKPLWFKTKKYGWGWTPSTWQGWLVILVYLGLVLGISWQMGSTPEMPLFFLPQTILLTALLLVICYATGEPPRWRWGDDEPKNRKSKRS
jgi:hypothetical protein